MNLTLFLGAGFSAPFGQPVMNNFLQVADASPVLNDDDRSFLGRLVLEARRANSFLESSPTNLEDILSFAEMGERLHLTEEKGEDRSHWLRIIIKKIYTYLPSASGYWAKYKPLEKLLGHNLSDFPGSLSFITTNYDLNAESACASMDVNTYPGFELTRVESVGPTVKECFYAPNGIKLFKLHGSVNWFPSKEKPGLVEVDDRVVTIRGNIKGESSLSIPYPCASDYPVQDAPVIIPPSFLKPDLIDTLKQVWAGAAKVLSTTNYLVFIGYSFPPSDTEMMYFLARALMENASLRVIYVVDPQAEEIVKRLKTVGSKMGSHFRDLLEPVKEDWRLVQSISRPLSPFAMSAI